MVAALAVVGASAGVALSAVGPEDVAGVGGEEESLSGEGGDEGSSSAGEFEVGEEVGTESESEEEESDEDDDDDDGDIDDDGVLALGEEAGVGDDFGVAAVGALALLFGAAADCVEAEGDDDGVVAGDDDDDNDDDSDVAEFMSEKEFQ